MFYECYELVPIEASGCLLILKDTDIRIYTDETDNTDLRILGEHNEYLRICPYELRTLRIYEKLKKAWEIII